MSESEYKLFLHLIVYMLEHPSTILPLHKQISLVNKLCPTVKEKLYSTFSYGLVGYNRFLLDFIVSQSTTINEVNNRLSLLSSLPNDVLSDLEKILDKQKFIAMDKEILRRI